MRRFSPHGVAYSGNYLNADDFSHYPDVTERMLAMLEPPNARFPGRPTEFRYELAPGDEGRKSESGACLCVLWGGG